MTGEPARTPFNIATLRAALPEQRVVPVSQRVQREALAYDGLYPLPASYR